MPAPADLTPEQKRALLQELLARKQQAGAAVVPEQTDGPPTSAQERIYALARQAGAGSDFHIGGLLRLEGPLDPAALARALQALVDRHGALRSCFRTGEGGKLRIHTLPRLEVGLPLEPLPSSDPEAELLRLAQGWIEEPFALDRAPLFRMRLFRIDPLRHALALSFHNAIVDAQSISICIQDLAQLYQAEVERRAPNLAPLKLSAGDYVVREQALFASRRAAELEFWRRQLAGAPPALDLPTDLPRETATGFLRANRIERIEPPLAKALLALARSRGVTPFMLLQAAYFAWLSGLSGAADVVVGVATAGRAVPEARTQVGCFQNSIALRARIDPTEPFAALLQRVRSGCLDSFAHHALPFQEVVRAVKPPRQAGRMPVFQVMFGVELGNYGWQLPGVAVRWQDLDYGHARFDYIVRVLDEADGGLRLFITYRADLFRPETIARFAGSFVELCQRVVDAPEAPLSALLAISARAQPAAHQAAAAG